MFLLFLILQKEKVPLIIPHIGEILSWTPFDEWLGENSLE